MEVLAQYMKIILTVISCLLFGASSCFGWSAYMGEVASVVGGGATCSAELTVDTEIGDYWLSSSDIFTSNIFVTSATITVCQIDIRFNRYASDTSDYVLQLRTDDANKATETILATSNTVSNSLVSTSDDNLNSFVFSTPYNLSPGTYHWVLKRTGTTTAYQMLFRMTNAASEYVSRSVTGLDGSWTDVSITKSTRYIIYGEE